MQIGSSIRSIRRKRGITMGQLCEATGLSQGFMSQLENNKTSPSLATLETIATFLNVPISYLLLKQEERMNVVRKQDRTTSLFKGEHKIEHLGQIGGMRLYLSEIPPGQPEEGPMNEHEGIEAHYVMKGMIKACQGEDEYVLEEGDTFSWHSSVPHSVYNIGEETAVILIISHKEI
ncbi:helix-turn-helix domain-containing protein [Paenibacillus sp. S-38]|uniref:helix-turn-helix domain-containing protein n=1 Tax=Paenibacillus sp. S-38 TaxID=3416710 RepID=UPI003CF3803D